MRFPFSSLTQEEIRIFRSLSSPEKIQDFLNSIPINLERGGETCRSPRLVLEKRKAHCFEGALLAAAALWFQGEPPLLFDLGAEKKDLDHVVTLFKRHGRWGAISKTNHAALRYREPVYINLRELALSYFHEYFTHDGEKTMRSYSEKPFDLRKLGNEWVTSPKHLWTIDRALNKTPHEQILTKPMEKTLRLADKIERKAGRLTDWRS